MTVLDVLKAARKLLTAKRRWTTGHFARTSPKGNGVYACSPDAKCFCAVGAIQRCATNTALVDDAWDALQSALPKKGVVVAEYNDDPRRTHAQILKLYDRAIAKVSRES